MLPRSAYIHVPFCHRRCGYCNFTLIAGREQLVDKYLDCLEIELRQKLTAACPVDTIFLGGGTPTYLSPDALSRLLDIISSWLKLETGGEFSCEANPLDCTPQRFELLKAAGVNRISIGGQSFNDEKLKRLERDHTSGQLTQALALANHYFSQTSLDLIFATPLETLDIWFKDLGDALRSPIQHLSTYGLTVERGTQFYNRSLRGELTELDDQLQLEMYAAAIDTLERSGWQHYEVSNFCLPGFQCRHNVNYWGAGSWRAFGPGATSFLFDKNNQSWTFESNHRSTTEYLKRIQRGQSPVAEVEQLNLEAWIRQRLVFGLRQRHGIDLAQLSMDWGDSIEVLFEPYLTRYLDSGWLERSGNQLRLTRAGLSISDSLWPDLLSN